MVSNRAMASQIETVDPSDNDNDRIRIKQLEPDPRGGRAYQLVYYVEVPIDVHWRFKTDFDNDFLIGNQFIREHRFISRDGNQVITETKHIEGPDVYFRWKTTLFEEERRMVFELLNPEECGQRFHYGSIQISAAAEDETRITQVAYFDFFGAAIWAGYPWRGGMRHYLKYNAQWEQDTILHLQDHYTFDSEEE